MASRQRKNTKAAAKPQPPTAPEKFLRLMVLSLVISCILGMGWWQFASWINDPETLPVKVVRIDGQLKKLKIQKLEAAVADQVTGGYFNIDLQAIKDAAMQLPWVDGVSIKRLWPDTLVMQITEKQAFARWGRDRLITADGKIFSPESGIDKSLPVLDGRDDRAKDIVEVYQRETNRFAKFALQIKSIQLTKRGSWVMQFGNGMQVLVGREDVDKRLARLATSLLMMKDYRGLPDRVDLRYPHGMAVSWKEQPETDKNKKADQSKLVAKEAV